MKKKINKKPFEHKEPSNLMLPKNAPYGVICPICKNKFSVKSI